MRRQEDIHVAKSNKGKGEEAPAITIADLAGMVTKFADTVGGEIAGIGERLAKLETAKPVAGKAAAKAEKGPKVAIPHTAALGSLKGVCSVSAQRIVEANYGRGEKAMGEYLAKLAEFQRSPEHPSTRMAYAQGLAKHGWAKAGK
jgi:hypothetical protein